MLLYKPLSLPWGGAEHALALPDATHALCGDKGINVAVGGGAVSIVYRGTFDAKTGRNSWAYSYTKLGQDGLEAAPFDIDYSCKMALIRINAFIRDYPTKV